MLMKNCKWRRILKGSIILVALSFTGLVGAQTCNSGTNQCSGQISRVNIGGNGNIAIAIEGVSIPADAGCSSPSNFFQIPASAANARENYAMALTAFAAGSNIVIRTFANDPICSVRSMFIGE